MNLDPQLLKSAAIKTLEIEKDALTYTLENLGNEIVDASQCILKHSGKVVITGMGKSGRIAQKIAATLSSTGTPAVFLHASEALHGDMGLYQPGDPTILLSKSGSTLELLRLIPTLRDFKSPLIAMVGNMDSPLARESDIVFNATVKQEADPLGVVPTSSSLVTLALGDALASALMYARGFEAGDFARLHPAGQLGRNLQLKVVDVMHPIEEVAVVQSDVALRQILIGLTEHPLGAVCVLDEENDLVGIVTDGDIRRALQKEGDNVMTLKAHEIMTANPISIPPEANVGDAVRLMEDRPSQISVLPVVEALGKKCVGLIRIHDIYQPHLI